MQVSFSSLRGQGFAVHSSFQPYKTQSFLLRRGCPWGCHSATQLRNHVLTARAQGNPCVVQGWGWSCGWRVAGGTVGSYPQPQWPAPGLIKLPIKDNRYCTLEGKGLSQAIFYLFSLLEPKDSAHILSLHLSLAYICQTADLGAVG